MTKQEKFYGILKQLRLDIRLEVILADLVTESLSMDDLVIISNSLFKRNYHHDIESIEEIEYPQSKKRKLSFVVNRNGIYDGLPQDLLHQPQSANALDLDTIINDMVAQEEIKKTARQFFLPIEQEFYRQRVKLEVEERKFLFETNTELPGNLFSYLWSLPDCLDTIQKSKLGILMPILNGIVGDIQVCTFIIQTISGEDVSLIETLPTNHIINDSPVLSETRLGVDCILGGTLTEQQYGITVRIHLDKVDEVLDYMEGGKKIAIYKFLCDLLIPYDKNVQFELCFSKNRTPFTLETEKPYQGRLNYTTFI